MSDVDSSSSSTVVVVDDDDLFRESLTRNLSDAGFQVSDFPDGMSAFDYLAAGTGADVAIFDWRMPGMTGIELLKRLRQNGSDLPVIFLTALTDQIYEEAALATGAVDFVEKARSFSILLKRIQLILEGTKATAAAQAAGGSPAEELAETTQIGHLTLRSNTGRALWKGDGVDLTLTEFKMVAYLATSAGHEVTYRTLYDLVHGTGFFAGTGGDGYRANVRTFIKRIRKKFRDVDPDWDEIENYAGFGYRWKQIG